MTGAAVMAGFSLDQLRAAYSQVQQKYSFPYLLKKEQEEAILHLLNKQNVFSVLPTGFGKSDLFILTPLLLDQVG